MVDPYETSIRPVSPEDAQELCCFFTRNSGPATTQFFEPFPLTRETANRIALLPRRDVYYVALFGKRIVGMSMLRGWDEGYDVPSFGVMIDSDCRGNGLGRLLTTWTLQAAQELSCSKVRLSVNTANTTGIHLYESLGFEKQSESTKVEHGQPVTKMIMIKTLTPKVTQ
ncbi:MAG: GNAT family N-acetyltransferase [bacterium]